MAVVQRVAAVQGLVRNSKLSHSRFSRAGDSGRSLLTGGRCSEVAVSTGSTVQSNLCKDPPLNNDYLSTISNMIFQFPILRTGTGI